MALPARARPVDDDDDEKPELEDNESVMGDDDEDESAGKAIVAEQKVIERTIEEGAVAGETEVHMTATKPSFSAIPSKAPGDLDASGDLRVDGAVAGEPKLSRARPKFSHKRYRPPRKNDGSELPRLHNYTHIPADPRCRICAEVKLKQQRAMRLSPRDAEYKRATHHLERVHMDILGPTGVDILGNPYLLVTRDDATNCPRVVPIVDRQPETVWKVIIGIFPGSRHERPPRFPALFSWDMDGAFHASLEEECRKRGADFRWGLERRPETNAGYERFSETAERTTAASLLQSGMPYGYWSPASRCGSF